MYIYFTVKYLLNLGSSPLTFVIYIYKKTLFNGYF